MSSIHTCGVTVATFRAKMRVMLSLLHIHCHFSALQNLTSVTLLSSGGHFARSRV